MNEKIVGMLLASPYAAIIIPIAFILLVLWVFRMGFLNFSKDKIQMSADAGSLAVVDLLRKELERMQAQLERERQQTLADVAAERKDCDERIARLRERIAVLENHIKELQGGKA